MINSMTRSERSRFLEERMKDEKQFYTCSEFDICRFRNFKLMEVEKDGTEIYSSLSLNYLLSSPLRLKSQWEFTEDEKVILRNLSDEFRWIARDETIDGLYAHVFKPSRAYRTWLASSGKMTSLCGFNHLFQSIQWSDDEPCEFRKYL